MIYGYIRVSTDKQTVENQRLAIESFCSSINVVVDEWIEETISGKVNFKRRKLGALFSRLQPGDRVYITEISRLERNVFSVFNMVLELLKKEVIVYSILENLEITDSADCAMKIFSTAYSAQVEREKLVERTKMGLDRVRREGKIIGRQCGQVNYNHKLDKDKDKIIIWLKAGKSQTYIAKQLGVSWKCVDAFMQRENLMNYKIFPSSKIFRKDFKVQVDK